MPKRRISIPEDHVAVILPNQLADELMSLARQHRAIQLTRAERLKDDELKEHSRIEATIFGELILALLEAKEV